MSDAPDKPDYRPTVFLPKTDFPMKAGLPQKEPAILERWLAEDLYGQVRSARAGRDKFILHDGPPYANGDIHIGHALNHVLKDMVVRTQTLLGKDAPYVPGWDCHGLPIEWKVEEQYRKKKLNKDEVPVREFRAECRAYAQHWVDVQREQLKRLGIGGDWDHPYLTMQFDSEATIVSELFKFAESGQLYRGAKPVMWSPVEKTALAEAEIEYEDVVSTQIDVAFEIVESPIPELVGAYAVIWTTTPWTIPVNQAIAYGPDLSYDLVEWRGRKLLVAFGCQANSLTRWGFEPTSGEGRMAAMYSGAQLAGTIARHPMHKLGGFFAKPRPFLPGDFVTTDQGTGLVHMAPDHGEDDFELCRAHGIDPVFAVQADGRYREDWAWLGGNPLSVINPKLNAPDGPICSDLREVGGLLSASHDLNHSYPHSWRSKAKVIYRCTPQWFIGMDRPLPVEHCESFAEQRWDNEGGSQPGVTPAQAGVSGQEDAAANHSEMPASAGMTLRWLAERSLAETRFVPEKGRNRIGSMVEQRPDWVISRQRAWGVPIALFVERKSGELLVDPDVNRRIVEGIREEGVDAWAPENAARFLGPRNPDDYEMIGDILDVWFDSGCTHAFVLESGRWPDLRWPADLYLEGSDQHRGWFQSSLLESCGTRGRAPYQAVMTHGFTMDARGEKMSKSKGNTVSPLDLMKEHGADILRLWALSVDFFEDHRIGKEILAGVADQYRKLRNTLRYLLGALSDFSDDEKVAVDAMPELERYMLHLTAELDSKLRRAVDDFDFNSYTRLLSEFANNDLSAFYFDIRKDVLYCDVNALTGAQSDRRRAYRTVLDTLFHALVRWLAPVLVFTSEEVWGTRFPEAGSVHLLEWPDVFPSRHSRESGNPAQEGLGPRLHGDDEWVAKWNALRALRSQVTETIEPLRRDKVVGSSLQAEVTVPEMLASPEELAELFITSTVHRGDELSVTKTSNHKCGRCWRHLPEVPEDGALCARCEDVVNG
ncbi:MAG TPA: isoleucine--tRNA ligase [Sphingomicrobium sp.]|nr:isoleucine--tRNA ligase [Sphingomicrobium sp.]